MTIQKARVEKNGFAAGIAALCVSVYSKIKYGKFDFRKTISDAERENKEGS